MVYLQVKPFPLLHIKGLGTGVRLNSREKGTLRSKLLGWEDGGQLFQHPRANLQEVEHKGRSEI